MPNEIDAEEAQLEVMEHSLAAIWQLDQSPQLISPANPLPSDGTPLPSDGTPLPSDGTVISPANPLPTDGTVTIITVKVNATMTKTIFTFNSYCICSVKYKNSSLF